MKEFYLSDKDLKSVLEGCTDVHLYTKDSKGWHWTEHILKRDDLED